MSNYEIRLHRLDGTLSIVMKVTAVGDADARNQARTMLTADIPSAQIWRDDSLIGSVHAPLELAKSA